MSLAPAVLFIYSFESELISVLLSKRSQNGYIEREMCGKTVKNKTVSNRVGSWPVARRRAKVRSCCHDNIFPLRLVLAKTTRKKKWRDGKKSAMKKQKSIGEDEFIKNRKWNNKVRETPWGRKWSSEAAAMATVPSTQLVEKKAMLRVSRGLSWVQSGDLVWGSDSPVREELST